MFLRLFFVLAAMVSMACSEVPEGRFGPQSFTPLTQLTPEQIADLPPSVADVFKTGAKKAQSVFDVALCDLNDDSTAEMLVFGRKAPLCDDAGNCEFYVISEAEPVLEALGEVTLGSSYSMRWRDLILNVPGDAPRVYKYDGAEYLDDLFGLIYGEVELFDEGEETAANGLPDMHGFIEIARIDDYPHSAAIEDFLWWFIRSQVDWNNTLPEEFSVSFADLNGDTIREIIVQSVSSAYCGSAGCNYWIFRADGPEDYTPIGQLFGGNLEVASSTQNGYRDLVVGVRKGLVLYRFDEGEYNPIASE